MKFICYPKCSTCQKARKWLDDNGIAYKLRDIKTENPTYEELAAWHALSGLPLKKFFNTSGLLYKSMNLKEKLPDMSEDEQLKLLATDGMLVKRPLFGLRRLRPRRLQSLRVGSEAKITKNNCADTKQKRRCYICVSVQITIAVRAAKGPTQSGFSQKTSFLLPKHGPEA